MRVQVAMLVALALLGCSSKQSETPSRTTSAGSEKPKPPPLRLPGSVRPTETRAHLTIDPSRSQFTGVVEIDIEVTRADDILWLSGKDLKITKAALRRESRDTALDVVHNGGGFIGLRGVIPAAGSTLVIHYEGKIDETETAGVFRQKDGDHWYVYTQFEATDARRAFPCFDEPRFKAPWQLTIDTPEGVLAISNTPVEKSEKLADGTIRHRFAKTKPLPSYLVAFGVGPFDIVAAGHTRSGVPVRFITPKGRAAETEYAATITIPVLNQLEDHFGSPYPFAKLDSLAIPTTVGFGAMENPGLITYNESLLLAKPGRATFRHERYYAYVAAHELGHQWFGNLVTTDWWNDIWLNESFASFSEGIAIAGLRPKWRPELSQLDERDSAMSADSLASARKIRQPIEIEDDIDNAFDSITYEKGASVLRMFESYLGRDKFAAGLRAYLDAHKWRTATASDFLAAMDKGTGEKISGAMNSFLTQVGVPEVEVSLHCGTGKASLVFSQRRYLPLGSKADANVRWSFPVCASLAGRKTQCAMLEGESVEMPLSDCPAWVLPNPGGSGYYRWTMAGEPLTQLLGQGLAEMKPIDKSALLDEVYAQVESGVVKVKVLVDLIRKLAPQRELGLYDRAAASALALRSLVGPGEQELYAKFLRTNFGPSARALGWKPKKGEPIAAALARRELLTVAALHGGEPALVAEGLKIAARWQHDPKSVPADAVDLALAVTARYGDAKALDRMFTAAAAAETRNDKRRYYQALVQGVDPSIIDRIAKGVLDGTIDVRDVMRPMRGIGGNPPLRERLWELTVKYWDALVAKMPRWSATRLMTAGVSLCDAKRRDEIKAFLEPRVTKLPGGARTWAQGLERLDLCIAQRAAHAGDLAAALAQ